MENKNIVASALLHSFRSSQTLSILFSSKMHSAPQVKHSLKQHKFHAELFRLR